MKVSTPLVNAHGSVKASALVNASGPVNENGSNSMSHESGPPDERLQQKALGSRCPETDAALSQHRSG